MAFLLDTGDGDHQIRDVSVIIGEQVYRGTGYTRIPWCRTVQVDATFATFNSSGHGHLAFEDVARIAAHLWLHAAKFMLFRFCPFKVIIFEDVSNDGSMREIFGETERRPKEKYVLIKLNVKNHKHYADIMMLKTGRDIWNILKLHRPLYPGFIVHAM